MALPKFYLETKKTSDGKQPINMFFSIYGARLKYYTGVRIEAKHYKDYRNVKGVDGKLARELIVDVDRGNIDKLISDQAPYANQIKANLKQLAIDVQNIANQAKANYIPVTPAHLRDELDRIHKHKAEVVTVENDFIAYYEKLIENSKSGLRVMILGNKAGKRYSHNAIKNYGSSLSAVRRYMASQKIKALRFDDINIRFYEKFRHFCYEVENKEISTFSGFIKDIKGVMNEAGEDGLQTSNGHKNKHFILPTYKADTIYLNEDQLQKIADVDLSDYSKFVMLNGKKITYGVLDKARDLMIVGAWSGLRFSNYANLKKENIQGDFIVVNQVKTGSQVKIYIAKEKLRPTLEKYDNKLPTLSNQKFNDYIKLVGKLAGLTETIAVKSYKGNNEVTNMVPLYSKLTSHCCRRSYATNMHKRGKFSEAEIMSATGHKSTSSFYKYIRVTPQEMAEIYAEKQIKEGL